jgi:hypothetical protein
VFVVLNIWLVLPHFGDLNKVRQESWIARTNLNLFQTEIAKESQYRKEMTNLASKGQVVAPDAQALELQREVNSQVIASGVNVKRWDPAPRASNTRSNAFFDEQGLLITIEAKPEELVDFLYNLAERNSLIRVRSLDLRPDPPRYRLQGSLTLVASYQKKSLLKAPSVTPAAASVKTTPTPATAAKTAPQPAQGPPSTAQTPPQAGKGPPSGPTASPPSGKAPPPSGSAPPSSAKAPPPPGKTAPAKETAAKEKPAKDATSTNAPAGKAASTRLLPGRTPLQTTPATK